MAPSVQVPNTSIIPMHASEVKRLAICSIAEMERDRKQQIEDAWREVKDEVCTHWWGLRSHRMYPDRETAMKYAPECQQAKRYARGDQATCHLLQKAAEYVLNDPAITNKTMYISLFDYRALT